jgi:hypothetical protein
MNRIPWILTATAFMMTPAFAEKPADNAEKLDCAETAQALNTDIKAHNRAMRAAFEPERQAAGVIEVFGQWRRPPTEEETERLQERLRAYRRACVKPEIEDAQTR